MPGGLGIRRPLIAALPYAGLRHDLISMAADQACETQAHDRLPPKPKARTTPYARIIALRIDADLIPMRLSRSANSRLRAPAVLVAMPHTG